MRFGGVELDLIGSKLTQNGPKWIKYIRNIQSMIVILIENGSKIVQKWTRSE